MRILLTRVHLSHQFLFGGATGPRPIFFFGAMICVCMCIFYYIRWRMNTRVSLYSLYLSRPSSRLARLDRVLADR